jgi:subtilisin-like proprotein convertase family protein
MPSDIKIKISKIYTKIDRIARSGRDYFMDYKKYVDELISKGDYDYLLMCLETLYDIDTRVYRNVSELKNRTWETILEKTTSSFVERLRKLYKSKGIYQQGNQLRSDSDGNVILSVSNTLDSNYAIVATSSKIEFTRKDDVINVDIIDSNLFNIDISKVTWSDLVPKSPTLLQNINSGTYNDVLSYVGSVTSSNILDNVNVVNSIMVNASDEIGLTELELNLDITHSHIGDLVINLKAPNGKVINVKTDGVLNSAANNYKNIKFTTSEDYKKLTILRTNNTNGKYQMDKYSGVGTQSYISNEPNLGGLLTNNRFNGKWDLFIRDVSTGDKGVLNSWGLDFSVLRKNDYFTQSSYPTQIPLTHGGTYLIEVEKKNSYGKFYYRLDISRDDYIGDINEVSVDNYLESNYYYRNKKLAEILGYKKTFLEVKKAGSEDVITIIHNDINVSEEMNLYQRYVMAIDYLLS